MHVLVCGEKCLVGSAGATVHNGSSLRARIAYVQIQYIRDFRRGIRTAGRAFAQQLGISQHGLSILTTTGETTGPTIQIRQRLVDLLDLRIDLDLQLDACN